MFTRQSALCSPSGGESRLLLMIKRLEEVLEEARIKGLDSTEEQRLIRSEFIYGMYTFKINTPYRGLMTREHMGYSEDAGYVLAEQKINYLLEQKRIKYEKEGGC